MVAEALPGPSRRHAHARGAHVARADGYARRRPEETVLHRVVRRAWPRFRERCEEVSGGGLPRFVRREVEGYLRCGLLEHGCVRLACAGGGANDEEKEGEGHSLRH